LKKLFAGALFLIACTCFAQVNVSVISPSMNATVASPVPLQTSASSSHPIIGWQVYVDSTDVYSAGAVSSIDTSLTVSQGSHQIVVRAWDSTGAYGSQTIAVSVQGTGTGTGTASPAPGLPTPPSTALVFTQIEQMSGWESCGTAACAGGSGKSAYWMAQNQTSPSLDGSSMELDNAGVWSNALWWKHLGANNNVSNFLWDFYVQLDSASTSQAQALEFDVYQFIGGYNYMIGSQCDYGNGVWDVWDGSNQKWIGTGIACQKLTPGTWHHIQWYVQRVPNTHNYHYVTLVVDGKSYSVNKTYSARNLGWADNMGVQYQLDVKASGGGYHEWVDKSTLTVW
jgi:hypothetical protein